MTVEDTRNERSRVVPEVHARFILDVLESAQSAPVSLFVANEETIDHQFDCRVVVVNEEIERPLLDLQLSAERLAFDIAFNIIRIMFRLGDEAINVIGSNR